MRCDRSRTGFEAGAAALTLRYAATRERLGAGGAHTTKQPYHHLITSVIPPACTYLMQSYSCTFRVTETCSQPLSLIVLKSQWHFICLLHQKLVSSSGSSAVKQWRTW